MDPYSIISNIPEPFIFNCWKHHFHFITDQIVKARKEQNDNELVRGLLKIGNSQIDFYIGEISPNQIINQISARLIKMNLMDPDPYLRWIHENPDAYQKIQIDDKSSWTMKEGNLYGRHVHIHPGRYSTHTIRVKAPVLKTTIAVMYLYFNDKNEVPNVRDINHARISMLDLPPVKEIKKGSEFLSVIKLFGDTVRSKEVTV